MTDAGLKELKDLKNLQWLDLFGPPVTGAGLKELKDLKNLQWLNISEGHVTDGVLRTLREIGLLHALRQAQAKDGKRPADPADVMTLDLTKTQVTDMGLMELKELKNLKLLNLSGIAVTGAGVEGTQGTQKPPDAGPRGFSSDRRGVEDVTGNRAAPRLGSSPSKGWETSFRSCRRDDAVPQQHSGDGRGAEGT